MKYLAAYALLTLGGNKNIEAKDVKALLGSVQVNASDEDLNRLIASLKGKSVHQIIAEGSAKLGNGAAIPAQAPADKKAKEAPKKEEPKKEEAKKKPEAKKEEPPAEEEDFGLGGGLFD